MGSEPFVGCLWLWFKPVKASCIFHATLSICFFLSFLLKSWSNSTSVCWFQWQNLDASRHWYWKASGFKESYINRFALSTLYYDAFFDINRFAYDIVHIFWWGDKVAAVLNGKEAPLQLLATLIYNTFREWLWCVVSITNTYKDYLFRVVFVSIVFWFKKPLV